MLGDKDIQALGGHLGIVVEENRRHHENVQNLLEEFRVLLDKYNRLKSDYEEEKESREKYKKLARGQERNPFVLVLVDGDGYLFRDSLIKAGSDGGTTAAQMLSDSIKELLHDQSVSQANQCRVMVRIYSNILGLSKTLARSGLVGNEARSLSPFASSFTRSQDLFDYIDAGDKKEGADYKIREMFRMFADNSQCKHIFFAGCHDSGYLSLLTPYRGRADRITLLRTSAFHPEYERLDLPVKELSAIFTAPPAAPPTNGSHGTHTNYVAQPPRQVCKHFQKGICKFGKDCLKLHATPNQQSSRSLDDLLSGAAAKPRDPDQYAKYLPKMSSKSQELIPVNKDGDRLDVYCHTPNVEEWETYNRRAKRHRMCNRYHLGGECGNLSCEYDHSPIDASCLNVMMNIMRQHNCSRGGSCRSIRCYLGHICQKPGCKGQGDLSQNPPTKGAKPCKYSRYAHTLDLQVAQWVTPIENEEDSPASVSSTEVNSTADTNAFSYLAKEPCSITM
ncbi:hypothetical protein BDV25DRAFT_151348 [Aspergillus avenaceus]|uniref:C3H1-type domain-containing protein n=1 Tax=Aspergillus avenaceus TaxID=36643 RepID=A0A5N6U271_ASPAV|nr:hypothetical protein BDV25DRAFT_151348 [Aspergillus avenaceus]